MATSVTVVREWPDASFDHAVSDIPYGIDMDNLDNVDDVKDEHDVSQQNVELMRPFLEETFRLVKARRLLCLLLRSRPPREAPCVG
jgi:hypothetical protein